MSVPKNLLYTNNHEWVKFITDDTAIIGLTDYAQESLGEIIFINLCMEGEIFEVGELIGDVESITEISDILCPLGGIVQKVNSKALEKPELINEDPYNTWLVEIGKITDKSALISSGEYEEFINSW